MLKKILIVDDDKAIRVLLTKLLGKEYEVESVECGEDALEIVPRFRPGIVFLDIMMPGIDGHETCRRLRDVRQIMPRAQCRFLNRKSTEWLLFP